MGQVSSSPHPHEAMVDIINLPKDAIVGLWLSYNLLGESWALNFDQFASIFKETDFLKANFNLSDDILLNIFKNFDTDENGLIDALETFVTIGLLSGISSGGLSIWVTTFA